MSRYTYLAPEGRTPAEVLRNYQMEFTRLDLQTLYEKAAGVKGWFGPTSRRSPTAPTDWIRSDGASSW